MSNFLPEEEIINRACKAFGIRKESLLSKCRRELTCLARTAVVNVMLDMGYNPYMIGYTLNRDRTIVYPTQESHNHLMKTNPVYRHKYNSILEEGPLPEIRQIWDNDKPHPICVQEHFPHHHYVSKDRKTKKVLDKLVNDLMRRNIIFVDRSEVNGKEIYSATLNIIE